MTEQPESDPTGLPPAAGLTSIGQAAVLLAAAVGACVAAALTHRVAGDPFTALSQAVPLVVAILIAVGCTALVLIGRERLAGAAGAVVVPIWLAFFCAWQLAGTPYAYAGNRFDIGRLSALATRFTVATGSADQFVKGLPTDYPPLFPWVVGKTASLTGVPAWRLLALGGVVWTALAVTIAYLLWQRLLPPALALCVSVIPPLTYQGDPRKAYEALALSVITPWLLTTFGRWPATRLHWLPAGIIGGLLVTDYPGYLVYTTPGLLVIIAMGLRRPGALVYLRHCVATVAVAVVVASWYLVPWAVQTLQHGSINMWVHYFPPKTQANVWWFPWSRGPFVSPMLIAGLALMIWFCRRQAWARYLLALALSATFYRWIWVVIHEHTGNTGMLEYTGRVSDVVETIGLVLGLHQLWGELVARRSLTLPRWLVAAAAPVAIFGMLAATQTLYWQYHRVRGFDTVYVNDAHRTYLPDGRTTKYASHVAALGFKPFFPAQAVRADVESVLGRNALPVTLSFSEAISAYYPFYLYVGVGSYSANSMSLWPERVAELRRLSQIADPDAFAAACARTRFGPIDVFILHRDGHGRYAWKYRVAFRSDQFSPQRFARFKEANRTVVLVRRGAHVEHHAYPR